MFLFAPFYFCFIGITLSYLTLIALLYSPWTTSPIETIEQPLGILNC